MDVKKQFFEAGHSWKRELSLINFKGFGILSME
jgi:hypothetical protein